MVLDENQKKKHGGGCLEDISMTIRFLCEWISVDGFNTRFVTDLSSLTSLEVINLYDYYFEGCFVKVVNI
jgi:hypothetical protein